jgi:pSer/pThr/pTyr-binding forkhead associated (FHA) protein
MLAPGSPERGVATEGWEQLSQSVAAEGHATERPKGSSERAGPEFAAPSAPLPASTQMPVSSLPSSALDRATVVRRTLGRVTVLLDDGTEGPSFPIFGEQLDIGREEGGVLLDADRFVSPRHARLSRVGGVWVLRDLASTNGVYVRVRGVHPLRDGDLLLLGLQVLQFRLMSEAERGLGPGEEHGTLLFGSPAPAAWARLSQRTVEGVARDVYHLTHDETVLGREQGDIVFTHDPFLSRRHAQVLRDGRASSSAASPAGARATQPTIVDLDSSNGVYLRLRGETPVASGSLFRVGQHLLRVHFD